MGSQIDIKQAIRRQVCDLGKYDRRIVQFFVKGQVTVDVNTNGHLKTPSKSFTPDPAGRTKHPRRIPGKISKAVWLVSHLGRAICIWQYVRHSRVRLRMLNETLPLKHLNARGFSVHGECDTDGRVLIGCVGRVQTPGRIVLPLPKGARYETWCGDAEAWNHAGADAAWLA